MREVDEALARVYSQQATASDRPRSGVREAVPPAPHLIPRLGSDTPPTAANIPGRTGPSATRLSWPALVRTLESLYGDRFERMADALMAARDRQQIKVLLFTSCHRAEGRTTLLLTLARALSRRGGRTLLVDADLAAPLLARQLGVKVAVGLDDVVERGHALTDALVEAPADRLTLLPLRRPVAQPRAFLANPAWTCTLARVRRDFDLVLVDGSPVFSGLSAAVLHRPVDAAVLVTSRAVSSARRVAQAREVLDAGGIRVLGVAETFVG
ncbi:MAG: cobalamin biosynthesis protein CobQ [Isosphaeraceae bacterium]